jgi:hypothetical protein
MGKRINKEFLVPISFRKKEDMYIKKVKREELQEGQQVSYGDDNWDVKISDKKVTLVNDHGDILIPSAFEFEVIHPKVHHCIVCGKAICSNKRYGLEEGIKLIGHGGYGSIHDDRVIKCIICDKCISTKIIKDE